MSLPSYLKLLDKDSEVVDTIFINVGWFLTPSNLSRELLKNVPLREDVETVVAYDYDIPYSWFMRLRDPLHEGETDEDRREEFERLLSIKMGRPT